MSNKTNNAIMFIDLEVDNNPYYGSTSSPHHPENYVVAVGWACEAEPYSGEIEYQYYESPEAATDWLNIPDDVWLVVGHNLSFELGWMYVQQYEALKRFVNRGGRFYCTQLGEFRLSRQTDMFPALDTTAPKYGGSRKIDAVKLLWDQGKLTSEIDKDLLIEYLAGSEGDIANTRTTFWGQYQALQERGMWDTVLMQCDGVLFNAVCMQNGVYVNSQVAEDNQRRLEERAEELRSEFMKTLEGFPEEIKAGFKTTSLYHTSAWIYGGSMRVNARVPSVDKDGNTRYEKADAVQCADTEEYTVVPEGASLEGLIPNPVRYARGRRAGQVKVFRIGTDTPRMRDGHKTYTCPGIVDLSKYDEEFRNTFLESYTTALKQHDGSPVISTSEEAFKDLIARPETTEQAKQVLEGLLEYMSIQKVVGTFYVREEFYADGRSKGLRGALRYLTDRGVIHHNLNVCATVTGRLSSSSPNYQNMPTGDWTGVHQYHESRFGSEGVVSETDYSNLEVVVLADLSKDENLMDIVRSGKSMHTINAAAIKGVSYEEYDRILKDRDHELHQEYVQFREACKPKEFSANYGAQARGVAYAAGCSIEEAQEFLDTKRKMFPKVEEFVRGVERSVYETATTSRELDADGRWRLFQTGYFKAPGGLEYQFRTYPRTVYTDTGPQEVQDFKPTQMRNYPIQGEASLFVQCATGWLIRRLFERDFYNMEVLPFNTVHDAVWIDMKIQHIQEVEKLLEETLTWIPQGMAQVGYNLDLEYPVETTVGPNLQDQYTVQEYLNTYKELV